jgi:hypothetical protein
MPSKFSNYKCLNKRLKKSLNVDASTQPLSHLIHNYFKLSQRNMSSLNMDLLDNMSMRGFLSPCNIIIGLFLNLFTFIR